MSWKQTSWGNCTGQKGHLGPPDETVDAVQLSQDCVNKPGMKERLTLLGKNQTSCWKEECALGCQSFEATNVQKICAPFGLNPFI